MLRLSGLWARGRAGPRALECFCRPVRGKLGRLGTGKLAGCGAAHTIRGTVHRACPHWRGPWLGAGFLPSRPRAAAPAFEAGCVAPLLKPVPPLTLVPWLWLFVSSARSPVVAPPLVYIWHSLCRPSVYLRRIS